MSWRLNREARATFCLLAVLSLFLGPSRSAAQQQPDVLVVVADDERVEPMAVMPHVQSFFTDQGTTYTNTYETPLCCPSRASIFSGRYPHNTGVWDDKSASKFQPWFSMQRVLSQAGYRTGIIGKYLNDISPLEAPWFDYRAELDNTASVERYQAPRLVQQFFDGGPTKPWFLYFSSHDPHGTWTDPPPADGQPIPTFAPALSYDELDLSDKDRSVQEAAAHFDAVKVKHAYYGQYAEVELLDDELREVLSIARQNRGARPLLAIYISDNGFQWGEHGLIQKGWPYWESIHVPLVVRWRGLASGATDGRLVSNVDLAPTVYQATHLDPGYTQDGQSLLRRPEPQCPAGRRPETPVVRVGETEPRVRAVRKRVDRGLRFAGRPLPARREQRRQARP